MVPTCQEFHAPIYKILKSESFGEFHYQTDHEYSFHHFVVLFHKFKNKVKPSLARYKGDKSKISGLHEIQCGTQNAIRVGGGVIVEFPLPFMGGSRQLVDNYP